MHRALRISALCHQTCPAVVGQASACQSERSSDFFLPRSPMPFELGLVFLLGLVSSLHCVQMCGPIVLAFSLPLPRPEALRAHLRYNAGRILTYAALGALAGARRRRHRPAGPPGGTGLRRANLRRRRHDRRGHPDHRPSARQQPDHHSKVKASPDAFRHSSASACSAPKGKFTPGPHPGIPPLRPGLRRPAEGSGFRQRLAGPSPCWLSSRHRRRAPHLRSRVFFRPASSLEQSPRRCVDAASPDALLVWRGLMTPVCHG